MDSRKYFVEQVASTIIKNHDHEDDSFIFGISGKWGEGKTRFLQDLEKELKKRDETFEILWINPWKFASDKISFLRAFLGKLPSPKLCFYSKVRAFLRNPTESRELYFDVSRDVIDWRVIIIFGLYLGLCLTLYFYGNQLPFWADIYKTIPVGIKTFLKIIAVSFIVPTGLALFKSVSTYQQGSKTISTVDKFDDLLKRKLDHNQGKKFLVYIDDLDRVTPTVARDVLDNLRTFFDKPKLSFIVAGDHTVLERYIGIELLPGNVDSAAQLEEGRRYLKKIFNVYWRLPPPISSELKQFINNDLFEVQKEELSKIFKDDESNTKLDKFGSILASYFDSNFRQIIRFFEMVIFTFQIINKKRDAVSGDEKLYFDELIGNPLLVIRILMFQENCTPLFESILRDPQILLQLEDAVEKKDASQIKTILSKQKLSENQALFINKFLFEEPRFYKDSSLVVSNLQPFLVFAADSSLGDGRGPSPEDFIKILNTGNPEAVKNTILSSGAPRLEDAASKFVTQYNSIASDMVQQNTLITTLLHALKEIPVTHNSHIIFAKKLDSINHDFTNSLSVNDRSIVYKLFWEWIDLISDKDLVSKFSTKFPALNIEDFLQIKIDKTVGSFFTMKVIGWFNQFYNSNKNQVLTKFLEVQSYFDKKSAISEIDSTISTLIEDTVHNISAVRDQSINVIIYSGRFLDFKTRILERVKDLDQDFWNWINGKLSSIKLDKDTLEESVITRLDKTSDLGTISATLNFSSNNNFSSVSEIWQKVIKWNIDILFLNISHFANNPLPQLTPDKSTGKSLFTSIADKLASHDQSAQISTIPYFKKDIWLWKNVDKLPSQKVFDTLSKDNNSEIARLSSEVLGSWKKTS